MSLNWDNLTPEELKEVLKKADAGEQWRIPIEIEGQYCALDCISTMQLYDKVFEPIMKRFPIYWDYQEPLLRTIHELIDQQLDGMPTDVEGLESLKVDIESKIETIKEEFFALEEIRPYLEEHLAARIDKIKVPEQYKKNGELSKNWINYSDKVAKMRQDSTFCFNPGSDKQLQWLFYERMYEAEKETIVYNRRDIVCYRLQSPKGEILLPATDSGQPPIDKHALPWLGSAGEVLSRLAKQETTLSTQMDACTRAGPSLKL
jgi:DNA polymerase I-like protein with 3'-5' exonuclease and polymerase domains